MNHIRRPVWFPATIVAVLIHVAVVLAMLLQAPTKGTALPGVSGMQVGLAAPGGAAGDVAEVEDPPMEAGARAPETAETVTTDTVTGAVPAPETVAQARNASAIAEPVEVPAVAEVRPPPRQPSAPPDTRPVTPVHETVEMVSPNPTTVTEAIRPANAPDMPIPSETVELVTEQVATTVAAQPADPVPEPEAPAQVTTPNAVEAVELSDPVPAPPPEPATQTATQIAPPPLPAPAPRRPVRQTVEVAQAQPAVEPETVAAVNATTPAPEAEAATDVARATGPGEATQQAALVTGRGGHTGDRSGAGVSSQDGARSGGDSPGAREDYMNRLLHWLERHKEYPRRAQRRREEGTALLFFRMDRDGRVTEFRIEQGSGHALLDAEVEAMIQRAQPLPAMPGFMRQSQLELVVPVKFALR